MFCCDKYQLNNSHSDTIIHVCACIFQGFDLESKSDVFTIFEQHNIKKNDTKTL